MSSSRNGTLILATGSGHGVFAYITVGIIVAGFVVFGVKVFLGRNKGNK